MYIYKITHKSTHQCYVGQTKDFLNRWRQHINENETRSPIQRALTEEKITNFTFEIIEECEDNRANERETFWIRYYNAYTEGYNTNNGTSIDNIIQPNTNNNIKPIQANITRSKVNSPDGVDAYDPKTGELVKHYDSIADANRALGKEGTGNISAVCRGRGKTAYGFIWRYTTPQDVKI